MMNVDITTIAKLEECAKEIFMNKLNTLTLSLSPLTELLLTPGMVGGINSVSSNDVAKIQKLTVKQVTLAQQKLEIATVETKRYFITIVNKIIDKIHNTVAKNMVANMEKQLIVNKKIIN